MPSLEVFVHLWALVIIKLIYSSYQKCDLIFNTVKITDTQSDTAITNLCVTNELKNMTE